ncbi:hypothetical protein EV127DRAFT_46848 [Xylaria flabelliformis]|nr:hypothetical protein EV127DRAFT_46848 [Xylaria flabelliformis]
MDSHQTLQHFDLFARISEVVAFDNVPVITVTIISFLCGYVQYYYAIRLSLSERKGPFPLWMHLFYFAHDSSWAYLLHNAAQDYGYHWFFTLSPWALGVWTVLQLVCIYRAVVIEGDEISSDQLRKRSQSQSLWYIAVFMCMMYGLIFVGIVLMGPTCFFQWAAIANIMMASGPTITWLRRGSRNGLSMSLAIVIVAGTVFTFAPFGMWVQVAPEIFDHPAYYFMGIVLTVLSITNVITVSSYPSKVARKGQSSPIW